MVSMPIKPQRRSAAETVISHGALLNLICFEPYGGMRNLRTLMLTEINQFQLPEVSHSAVTHNLCNKKRAPFEMTAQA